MLDKIFLYLYSKYNLILLIPHPIALGNCCEEIYEALRIATLQNKKILIILPIYVNIRFIPIKTLDSRLFALESKYFLLKPLSAFLIPIRLILWLAFLPVRTILIYLREWEILKIQKDFIPYFGAKFLFNSLENGPYKEFSVKHAVNEKVMRSNIANYDIKLSKHVNFKAAKFKKEINMSEKDWFVCLHIRTGGYYNDEEKSSDRNADISNFIPLINFITEKGGWVFRLGDKSMPKLDRNLLTRNEMVIDLPHSKFNRPEINAWLLANCNSFVGMLSGPEFYARLFVKPIILINMHSPFAGGTNEKNTIGIYKKFVDKKTGEEINFLNVLEKSRFNWNDLTILDYDVIELNSSEILRFSSPLIPFKYNVFQTTKNQLVNDEYDKKIIQAIQRFSYLDEVLDRELYRMVLRTVHIDSYE